jgi:hypothetical protein
MTDGRTDRQTDGQTEGKLIVPFGFAGRGLKMFTILLNYNTCPDVHAENDLSKLQIQFWADFDLSWAYLYLFDMNYFCDKADVNCKFQDSWGRSQKGT